MKRTPKTWIVFSILAVLICLAALPVMAAQSQSVEWYVIGGGGGSTTNGDYTLSGTIGQPVIGRNSNAELDLCSGFWCKVSDLYKAMLPLILRNY
jgi:hypothetical protein